MSALARRRRLVRHRRTQTKFVLNMKRRFQHISSTVIDSLRLFDAVSHNMKISARNQISGKVVAITPGALNASIKIDIGAGNVMTSNITEEAIADLGLAVGDAVIVFVKASDVLIGK